MNRMVSFSLMTIAQVEEWVQAAKAAASLGSFRYPENYRSMEPVLTLLITALEEVVRLRKLLAESPITDSSARGS